VIAEGTPDELKRRAGQDVVEVHARDREGVGIVAEALDDIGPAAPTVDLDARRVTVPVADGTTGLLASMRALDARRVAIDDIGLRRPTLDEVFLTLTGRPADTDLAASA
jgi:ABC-2 type transport system ATP-binding protein